jgi:hypothetical protein
MVQKSAVVNQLALRFCNCGNPRRGRQDVTILQYLNVFKTFTFLRRADKFAMECASSSFANGATWTSTLLLYAGAPFLQIPFFSRRAEPVMYPTISFYRALSYISEYYSVQKLRGVQPEFAVNVLSLRPGYERFRSSIFWALLGRTLLLPTKKDAIEYRRFVTQVCPRCLQFSVLSLCIFPVLRGPDKGVKMRARLTDFGSRILPAVFL